MESARQGDRLEEMEQRVSDENTYPFLAGDSALPGQQIE